MANSKVHVQRSGNLWTVRLGRSGKCFSRHASRHVAVEIGTHLAKLRGVEVLVQAGGEVSALDIEPHSHGSKT